MPAETLDVTARFVEGLWVRGQGIHGACAALEILSPRHMRRVGGREGWNAA